MELEHTMFFVPVLPYLYPLSQVTSTFALSVTWDPGEMLATNSMVGTVQSGTSEELSKIIHRTPTILVQLMRNRT